MQAFDNYCFITWYCRLGVIYLETVMESFSSLPSYVKTGTVLMCRCSGKPFFVGRILIVSELWL